MLTTKYIHLNAQLNSLCKQRFPPQVELLRGGQAEYFYNSLISRIVRVFMWEYYNLDYRKIGKNEMLTKKCVKQFMSWQPSHPIE